MKFWKRKQIDYYNYRYDCIHTLKVNEENGSSTNILKINENKIVSAVTKATYIKFWNIVTIKNIKTLKK